MSKYVYLMSKNPSKIFAAKKAFSEYEIELRSLDFEIPEIQADTSVEIAKYAVQQAWEIFHEPVIREDHSFFIDELGIPGPYMSYVERMIDIQKLTKLLSILNSKKGHFTVGTAYMSKKGGLHEFSFDVPIEFESVPRGRETTSWDRIIRLANETRVFTEYPEEERMHIWTTNYRNIANLIASED